VARYVQQSTAAITTGNNVIAIGYHDTPPEISFRITVGVGSGEVSANVVYTIDNPADSTAVWTLFARAGAGTTVSALSVPIQGLGFSVAVSGSSHASWSVLQAGN
jgi:hypothetical protein